MDLGTDRAVAAWAPAVRAASRTGRGIPRREENVMAYRKVIYEPDSVCHSCGHLGSKHDPDPHGGVDSCLACPGGRCQPARGLAGWSRKHGRLPPGEWEVTKPARRHPADLPGLRAEYDATAGALFDMLTEKPGDPSGG